MKQFYLPVFLSVLFICISCGSENEIEDETDPETDNLIFPDAAFKDALVNTNSVDTNNDGQGDVDMDTNNDGEIQRPEAEAAKGLILHFDYSRLDRYVDLSGIENIINLTSLSITGEGGFFEGNKTSKFINYDFTQLKELKYLKLNHLASNFIDKLDLSGLVKLEEVDLSFNRPNEYQQNFRIPMNYIWVNMEGCTGVTKLAFANSFLKLDLCQVPSVKVLDMWYLEGGEPSVFDFHCLEQLEWLDISENLIDSLILKNSSVVTTLGTADMGSDEGAYLPYAEFICIDDIQEERDQIATLVGPDKVVTTECPF